MSFYIFMRYMQMTNYPLHNSVLESDQEAIQKLIAEGIPLNKLDNLGNTALHWAVFRGDTDIVRLLLEAGADPNIMANDGVTPKWRACDFGLTDIENLLTSFGGIISTDNNFDSKSFGIFNGIIGNRLPENEV